MSNYACNINILRWRKKDKNEKLTVTQQTASEMKINLKRCNFPRWKAHHEMKPDKKKAEAGKHFFSPRIFYKTSRSSKCLDNSKTWKLQGT